MAFHPALCILLYIELKFLEKFHRTYWTNFNLSENHTLKVQVKEHTDA